MSARLALALGVLVPAFVAGALWPAPSFSALSTVGPSGRLAVTADFDGDGIPDPAVLRGGFAEVTLSRRHATIALRALPHTTGLAAADIDHDGDIDLVSIADGGLRGWSNQQSGSFKEWTIGPPRPMSLVRMAAVHWTSAVPFLPPAAAGRSRTDLPVDAAATFAPQLRPQTSHAIDAGRAPPRLIAFEHPSRAPPQTFVS